MTTTSRSASNRTRPARSRPPSWRHPTAPTCSTRTTYFAEGLHRFRNNDGPHLGRTEAPRRSSRRFERLPRHHSGRRFDRDLYDLSVVGEVRFASAAPASRRTTCSSRGSPRSTTTSVLSMKRTSRRRHHQLDAIDAYFETRPRHRQPHPPGAPPIHCCGTRPWTDDVRRLRGVHPQVDLDWSDLTQPDDVAEDHRHVASTREVRCASDKDGRISFNFQVKKDHS